MIRRDLPFAAKQNRIKTAIGVLAPRDRAEETGEELPANGVPQDAIVYRIISEVDKAVGKVNAAVA